MEIIWLLQNSFLLKHWNVIMTVLVLVAFGNFAYRKSFNKKAVGCRKSNIITLDSEEYVGADFSGTTEKCEIMSGGISCNQYVPALQVEEHVPFHGATVTLSDGAKQLYELANNRRSVRSYRAKPVPPLEVIIDCIRAAGTAPSGAHTEPWTFCIVKDFDLKQRIRDIVEKEEELNYAQRMHRQWTADLLPLRTNHMKPYLTDAPYLILVFKQVYGYLPDGSRKQHYYNEISVAIATGILLCALQAAGLNSLVTTPLNCGLALRTLLSRPENEKLLVLLPVGYAAENCFVPDLKRKKLEEIMRLY